MFRTWVEILISTALRVSEATYIKWGDFTTRSVGKRIFYDTVQIIVKGKRPEISIISPRANDWLNAYRKVSPFTGHDQYLFQSPYIENWPYGVEWFHKKFKKHIRAAALPPEFTAHKFRHWLLTQCKQSGMSTLMGMKLLHHMNADTQGIYESIPDEQAREEYDRCMSKRPFGAAIRIFGSKGTPSPFASRAKSPSSIKMAQLASRKVAPTCTNIGDGSSLEGPASRALRPMQRVS
jgi:integrase